MHLYLSAQSIVALTYIILSLIILFYLWKLKNKSGSTRAMLLLFSGLLLYFIFFFAAVSFSVAYNIYLFTLQYVVFQVVIMGILKFVYRFPRPLDRHRKEEKVVYSLSLLFFVSISSLGIRYITFFTGSGPDSAGNVLKTGSSLFHPASSLLVISLLITLQLIWAFGVMARRTVNFSRIAGHGKGSLSSHFLRPQTRAARSNRVFLLMMLIPLAGAFAVFLRDSGIFTFTTVDIFNDIMHMLFYYSIVVFHLNHAPETSTFMVKIVGASLVIILLVFSSVGRWLTPYVDESYRNEYGVTQQQTIVFHPDNPGYAIHAVPARFDHKLGDPLPLENGSYAIGGWDFPFPFNGSSRQEAFVNKDGFVTFDQPLTLVAIRGNFQEGISPMWLYLNLDRSGGIYRKSEKDRVTFTWWNMRDQDSGQRCSLQLVLSYDGSIQFNYLGIKGTGPRYAGLFSGEGFPAATAPAEEGNIDFDKSLPLVTRGITAIVNYYDHYRNYLHRMMKPLAIMLIIATAAILLVFPFFFKTSLVKPLRALLKGMKEVKQGTFSTAVPVRYHDEIGFLTDAFNRMVHHLKEAKDGWLDAVQTKDRLLALNRAILDTAAEGILTLDKDGHILSFNRAAEEMFNYTRDEIIGKPDHILLVQSLEPPDLSMGFMAHFLASDKQTRFGVNHIFLGKQKDSGSFPLEFAVSKTDPAETGGETIYTVILRDLTEHLKLAEEKKGLEKQLHQTQKLETIGTLAGGIAHDFNNILTPLIGYTEMAMVDIPEDSHVHNYLKNILSSSNRAKELVKQILAFSRKSESVFELVNVYAVVKESITLLRASTPSSISFDLHLDEEVGYVFGDPTQMGQVVINLCTNAAQAMMPRGGVLHVGLKLVEVDDEMAKMNPRIYQEHYVQLEVTDTGIGIGGETMARIFEPFFTTKPVGQGTGLGLSVVHGIVEKHGGTVQVGSQLGKGTTFRVYFPSMPGQDIEEMMEAQENLTGEGSILLVDDEEVIADMYSEWLKRAGYNVTVETDSTKTLEIFRAQPEKFDVLITDFTMPFMNGLQLAAEILQTRPGLPVILYSGNTEVIPMEEFQELGIYKLLMKPVTFAEMNRTIKEVTGKS